MSFERLPPTDRFAERHIGPDADQVRSMLQTLGCASLDALIEETVPASIRTARPLEVPPAADEAAARHELGEMMRTNVRRRSWLGEGYHGTITPPVILRNVLENPGWYTQYTP